MSSSRHILFFPALHHMSEANPAAEATTFEMVGDGDAMRRLHLQVKRIGPHFRTVLIRGELGSGKELAARALHRASEGAGGPFVVCNAASLEDAAADGTISEWLNNLMAAASKGTLFLDGIEEIPMAVQSRLLAALKRKACRRIIASTTEDLRVLAASGRFRPDLYHYIATVEIMVDPLRERREDIPSLAEYFLRCFSTLYGRRIYAMADDALERLITHEWPGNVRELENVIRNGVLQCEGTVLRAGDLTSLCELKADAVSADDVRPARLQEVIDQHVQRVLKTCSGNKVKAAEVLGISRSTLYRMLESGPGAR